ncbi:PaREP1 family protein [Caldivirga sp. MU80]|uniref:PaREP1 family protein n=1 Tax=Caldivirga sp. MU80 TaxID=1650354 RepID=UPI00082B6872|nr:PaREP1 family protein [Caldivirga sp. MU80]
MGEYTVTLPKRIIEEARRRNIDIEELILDAVSMILSDDPEAVIEARLEAAERYLNEARDYVNNSGAVQASEKMYKVVEECIKALAQAYNIEEYVKVSGEGRWWVSLIGKAARRLAGILNEPRVEFAWSVAYDLHVWGLHEAKYTINDVKGDLNHAQWLLEFTRSVTLRKSE